MYYLNYKDFTYQPLEDRDEDCTKIFHEVYKDGKHIGDIQGASTYRMLNAHQFYEVINNYLETKQLFIKD